MMPLTIFEYTHHAAGNAPDTTPIQIDLMPPAFRLDLAIFDNPAMISFSADGVFWSTEREFPAGVLSSLDIAVESVRIRNKTALSVARYDLNGFYGPVEVTGQPYKEMGRR